MSLPVTRSGRFCAGFTTVELITVIVLMGILGAIGVSRFFDNTVFESRAYADQAKAVIRYAQKLAIAQNRAIFVRANGNSFAVCSGATCLAAELVAAPGGSNSGSAATRNACQGNATWMCEGRPANVAVVVNPPLAANGVFFFDAMGRPYNGGDAVNGLSTFQQTTFTFSSGASAFPIVIWPETGYVQ
jgi:MSHA pilin protein MshC